MSCQAADPASLDLPSGHLPVHVSRTSLDSTPLPAWRAPLSPATVANSSAPVLVRRVIPRLTACLASGKYPGPVFSPRGPSVRELAMQALSSVEDGYDLLAPKFDHTPFRTPDGVLDATAGALHPLGPFGRGLYVCCGTGAGIGVLASLCQAPVMGVDFSTGMLAQARGAHPDAQ